MADYRKVHQTLGIQTITAQEFQVLMQMRNAAMKRSMLEALAKNERGFANYQALMNALSDAGLR